MYDLDPGDAQRERVVRAAAACPVQAILVENTGREAGSKADVSADGTAEVPRARSGNGAGLGRTSRIVIVGGSLAGARAASVLRRDGFTGSLTLIEDEKHDPYDRPPLSKQVLSGSIPADHTMLPRMHNFDAEWLRGQRATGLDMEGKRVSLADGSEVAFDRLLIATGVRARPWPNKEEAALDGMFVVHTMEDAARFRQRIAQHAGRVLVMGAGFTGSEVASVCREQGLPVTVVERGPAHSRGPSAGQSARSLRTCSARTEWICDAASLSHGSREMPPGGCAGRTCLTVTRLMSSSPWPRSAPPGTSNG